MLPSINTQSQSVPPVTTLAGQDQQPSWHAWPDQVATTIAASAPDDPRIQFVANLVKDQATVAAIHALPDYLAHYRWLMETGDDPYPANQNGLAAPIQPGILAGHPDTWDIPADDEGDILPW